MKLSIANHAMFKRIICPTDFSKSSDQAVSVALDIARSHQSELIVLYAYRLILDEGKQLNGNKAFIKKEHEALAMEKFRELEQANPLFSKVRHVFVAEVGFIFERVSAAISDSKASLVVLSGDIQRRLKEHGGIDGGELTAYFGCPVLLVPNQGLVSKAHK